ncbi:hypothetical protein LDENG_00090570 [Lucifuga dentata]|nr:hypothetical protein LDENG_00090570 [Lucifuga dentata]
MKFPDRKPLPDLLNLTLVCCLRGSPTPSLHRAALQCLRVLLLIARLFWKLPAASSSRQQGSAAACVCLSCCGGIPVCVRCGCCPSTS